MCCMCVLYKVYIFSFLDLTFTKVHKLCLNQLNLMAYRVSVGAEVLFCKEGCTVAIDTGAAYITGPAGSVSVLMKAIGAIQQSEGEVITIKDTFLIIF